MRHKALTKNLTGKFLQSFKLRRQSDSNTITPWSYHIDLLKETKQVLTD